MCGEKNHRDRKSDFQLRVTCAGGGGRWVGVGGRGWAPEGVLGNEIEASRSGNTMTSGAISALASESEKLITANDPKAKSEELRISR